MEIRTCEEWVLNELETAQNEVVELKDFINCQQKEIVDLKEKIIRLEKNLSSLKAASDMYKELSAVNLQ